MLERLSKTRWGVRKTRTLKEYSNARPQEPAPAQSHYALQTPIGTAPGVRRRFDFTAVWLTVTYKPSFPSTRRNGLHHSLRCARCLACRRKKSQLTLAFFWIAPLTQQPVRLAAQQLRLPDDQAARRSTSERCHHHGNHTSGYADNHHYGWRNADPVRRRS